ncbi:MAG: OmpA family protein [SAR324 cluster bacterium]|nr:OmpA family protein [SAR324 cluster bacterium]
MKIFAAYLVFLSIIMAGCSSTTSEHISIGDEGLEEEAIMDQEHKKNIEELELQQSELLEGLLEEESVTESISEIFDDSEQYTNEEIDAAEDSNQLLAITELETEEVIETEPTVNEITNEEEKKEPSLMELLESSFEKDTSEDTTKITAQQEPQLPPTPSLPREIAVIPSPEKEPDTQIFKPQSPLAISSLRKLVACSLVSELMDEIHKRLQKTKGITIADRRLRDSNNDRLMPVVYFDFDQIKIKPDFREMLRQQSTCVMKELEARGDMVLQIEGHADERGSDEYNIALGHRRANAIANSIMAYLTNPEITQIISYGEEFPLVPQSNINAWARNRRVEFTLLLK